MTKLPRSEQIWWIWDLKESRVYILRGYLTAEDARRELAILLRGFPIGHPWRDRLTVKEIRK